MITGLYAAANGMRAVENRQAVIANNIANASTPGFKRQLAVTRGYYETFALNGRLPAALNHQRAPGGGIKVIQTHSDYSDGASSMTGNPLDLAVAGPGFLAVNTAQGERFTRNGRLSIGLNGVLQTSSGEEVQDVGGSAIELPPGPVEIRGDGRVVVNGRPVGQLRLVEFENPRLLNREGYTLFAASEEALQQLRAAETTTVVGGAIEVSNVQIPIELTQMTMALRSYSANQRVITAIDDTLNRLIDQVGAPS